MIKSCIFDMDGTLVDSMGFWHDCGEIFVRSQRLVPERNLSKKLFRLSMDAGVAYLKERYFDSLSVESIYGGIINILSDAYAEKIAMKAGAAEFLARLKDLNIPCVLATATPRELFAPMLKRLELSSFFSAVLTCPELDTDKGSPLIYLKAAALLGTRAAETAVFEDALIPCCTSKGAGFYTVGVSDKYSAGEASLIKKTCDSYLDTFVGAENSLSGVWG